MSQPLSPAQKKLRRRGIILICLPIVLPIITILLNAAVNTFLLEPSLSSSNVNGEESSVFADKALYDSPIHIFMNVLTFLVGAVSIIGFVPMLVIGIMTLMKSSGTSDPDGRFVTVSQPNQPTSTDSGATGSSDNINTP